MACDCELYTCLDTAPSIVQCGEDIVVLLMATQTGTWTMAVEFNGRQNGYSIDAVQGEYLQLPNVFNEQYKHTIRFYNTSGALVNDTCYTLNAGQIMRNGTYSSPAASGGFSYMDIEAESGATLTLPAGVTAIIIFDGQQSYTQSQFTQVNNIVTMTNGTMFYEGQLITILYI